MRGFIAMFAEYRVVPLRACSWYLRTLHTRFSFVVGFIEASHCGALELSRLEFGF